VREVLPLEGSVRVSLAEGDVLRARLVIGADGAGSITRTGAAIAARTWTYPQAAIVGMFAHSRALRGVTTELHRRGGPLTIVPLYTGQSSFVWVEETRCAARLAALAERDFVAEFSHRLKGIAGALASAGPRSVFALGGLKAERMAAHRIALVGEAAHVLPPIGAQGLNISLRDAAALADCVSRALATAEDVGGETTLANYQAARAGDVATLTLLVDLLNRSLLSDFLPLAVARGVGLHLLANLPALRRVAVAGGLRASSLPPLMRP
jgi:2-octaprenyl-6-methoxyphenol hydroxylase